MTKLVHPSYSGNTENVEPKLQEW